MAFGVSASRMYAVGPLLTRLGGRAQHATLRYACFACDNATTGATSNLRRWSGSAMIPKLITAIEEADRHGLWKEAS